MQNIIQKEGLDGAYFTVIRFISIFNCFSKKKMKIL